MGQGLDHGVAQAAGVRPRARPGRPVTRIPVTRHNPDGTTTDGTALIDLRDLDGQPLELTDGCSIEFDLNDLNGDTE